MANILSALGNAMKSNTAGALASGLMMGQDRRRGLQALDEQRQQTQAEREFASAFNSRLLSGDVDGATRTIQEYGGRVSPEAVSRATMAVTAAQGQRRQEQRGNEDVQAMAAALGGGATPDEAQLLAGAQRAGGNAFLDAARGVNRMRTEADKERQRASALKNFLRIGDKGVYNTQTGKFTSFPGGGPDRGLVEAVKTSPDLFGELSASKQAELIPALSRSGFDFSKALEAPGGPKGGEALRVRKLELARQLVRQKQFRSLAEALEFIEGGKRPVPGAGGVRLPDLDIGAPGGGPGVSPGGRGAASAPPVSDPGVEAAAKHLRGRPVEEIESELEASQSLTDDQKRQVRQMLGLEPLSPRGGLLRSLGRLGQRRTVPALPGVGG